MERLTERNKNGLAMAACCGKDCEYNYVCEVGGFGECRGMDDIIDRLAAIEDILGDDYNIDRLRELVEADREGRCVIADAPPSPGKRYVLRAMCRYCPDNYRIGPRCFQQKKCKVKVLEETRAKEEAGFSENTGGA